MAALLKYIKNNSWKTIQADWQEYKELKNRCKDLEREAFHTGRTLLCSKEAYLEDNIPLRCVRVMTNDCFNPYEPDGVSGYWSSEYCPHFSKYDETIPCSKQDCPYVEFNRKHSDAVKRYRHLMRAKEDFWNKKMTRTK